MSNKIEKKQPEGNKLDDRLSRLAAQQTPEAHPRPVYTKSTTESRQVSGGATKKINIDMSKYNQILSENWDKLSPKDYIRYIKKSDPENPKGGTIRSITMTDGENQFVLSSYNRVWYVPFKDIKTVYLLNKEHLKETGKANQAEVKVAAAPASSVLDNFREISRETSSVKYDELAAEIVSLKREVAYMKDTISKLTTWVNKQIDMANQGKL